MENNQQPRPKRPKGTGYAVLKRYLHSGFNTFNKRHEWRGIKPLSTNKINIISLLIAMLLFLSGCKTYSTVNNIILEIEEEFFPFIFLCAS
ncbi:MAG: hypothetical protein FWD28_03075 [Treponema sp.]|nr:hypothetical protein [Treponema sp.]